MEQQTVTEQVLAAFQKQLRREEKSDATVTKYIHDVRCFGAYAQGGEIQKELVLSYKTHLSRHYATASANSMLAALNAFLRFLGRQDCCVKQFRLQRKTYCSEEDELSRGEYIALVETARRRRNPRLSLLIQTICGTGIRVSEVPFITVEAARRGEAVVSCKGKTRKVFLVPALRKKLLTYARQQGIASGMIFVTKNGRPLNRSNIWREMKDLCRQAGVSMAKVFPHNLRHLFARTFYGLEKDIAKLADILGHTNINTTRIYIISTGQEHKRRMENMRLIL